MSVDPCGIDGGRGVAPVVVARDRRARRGVRRAVEGRMVGLVWFVVWMELMELEPVRLVVEVCVDLLACWS
jgi:hypothetical protein